MAKRLKERFTTDHVKKFFETLKNLRDLELLVLKSHAGMEQLLFTAVAARLNVEVEDMPQRLQFKTLLDLALAGANQPRFVGLLDRFAGIRNMFAHEMEPDAERGGKALEEFVELTHSWADEVSEQYLGIRRAKDAGWIITEWGNRDELTVARRIRGAIGILFSHLSHVTREMIYLSRDEPTPPLSEVSSPEA